jgi:hypothetical protein
MLLGPSTGPFQSQLTPVHNDPSYFFKTHFNVKSHLYLNLPSGILLLGFPSTTLYGYLFAPIHAIFPTYPLRYDQANSIWAEYK